jgi:hypothetical protein
VWKKGAVLSLLGKVSTKKSLDKTTRELSLGIGTDHTMDLLGKMHKNEITSFLWDRERATKIKNSRNLPLLNKEARPPSCLQPYT